MSAITTVYNELLTRITALLSSHKRLPNPNRIEENVKSLFEIGFAVALGPGENTRREFNKLSVRRDMIVTITRRVFKRETDPTGRADIEKLLFEDQQLLISDFEKDGTLGGTICLNTEYDADGGIDFVYADKDTFLKLETTFTIEYIEDFN